MITAVITNVTKDKDRVVAFARFSDGEERSFIFLPETTRTLIKQAIKGVIAEKNDLENKVATFQDLIGVELN